ncbi:hypothetical protein Y032_0074g910 [Ancylostoma ceylanicum]|uniref:Uncharacterized protein n=1 Tax=Ancylostoma ceylanicum TaxID=53326 RepID=A0A016TWR7_9BILA|nr:hypothetical protein Y032_0074g910 [Ancylostoma ceylanicum]
MVGFYFVALAAIFLLPTFGDASRVEYCPGSNITREEVIEMVKLINHHRTLLVKGEHNSGIPGKKLPPAKRMTKIALEDDD